MYLLFTEFTEDHNLSTMDFLGDIDAMYRLLVTVLNSQEGMYASQTVNTIAEREIGGVSVIEILSTGMKFSYIL